MPQIPPQVLVELVYKVLLMVFFMAAAAAAVKILIQFLALVLTVAEMADPLTHILLDKTRHLIVVPEAAVDLRPVLILMQAEVLRVLL